MRFRISRWRATVLLAVLALISGFPAAASASSATNTGWISLGNLVRDHVRRGPVRVCVRRFQPQLVEHDLGYGAVSAFELVNAGGYSVEMRAAGSPESSSPILTAAVTVQAGHSHAVAPLNTSSSARQLKVLDDSLIDAGGQVPGAGDPGVGAPEVGDVPLQLRKGRAGEHRHRRGARLGERLRDDPARRLELRPRRDPPRRRASRSGCPRARYTPRWWSTVTAAWR